MHCIKMHKNKTNMQHVINIQLHRFAYPGHDSIPLEVLGRHGLTKVRPKRKWE